MRALRESWRNAVDQRDREHVVTYVMDRPNEFLIRWVVAHSDLIEHNDLDVSIDETGDLEMLDRMYTRLGRPLFYLPARGIVEAVLAVEELPVAA